MTKEEAFSNLCEIEARLRGPGGCPWDMEQTPQSMASDLVEETFECLEAIAEKDPPHIREELGDLFHLVIMLSYMHQEQGLFSISDVLENVSEKLVRRHPHVFAGLEVKDSAEVLDNWAKIKREQEGRKPKDSVIDEVQTGLPPLEYAAKLQKKAAKAGFNLQDIKAAMEKISEKMNQAVKADQLNQVPEEELGELLFTAINFCRLLKTDPSAVLIKANSGFKQRFRDWEKVKIKPADA